MEILHKKPIVFEDGTKGSLLILKCGCRWETSYSFQNWEMLCPHCESKRTAIRTDK